MLMYMRTYFQSYFICVKISEILTWWVRNKLYLHSKLPPTFLPCRPHHCLRLSPQPLLQQESLVGTFRMTEES